MKQVWGFLTFFVCLLLTPCARGRVFQLHEANSDFQGSLTLNTLYYVYHDHTNFHFLVSEM